MYEGVGMLCCRYICMLVCLYGMLDAGMLDAVTACPGLSMHSFNRWYACFVSWDTYVNVAAQQSMWNGIRHMYTVRK